MAANAEVNDATKGSQMRTATVTGVAFSGKRKAARFVEMPWAKSQMEAALGFNPYPGTLNLRLPRKEAIRVTQILKKCEHTDLAPSEGYFPARCFKVTIMGTLGGAIVVPEKPGYPSNVLEIIAPVNLRRALSIIDGDLIELALTIGGVAKG